MVPVLARMWRNWSPYILLVGMYNGIAILENNPAVPQMVKHRVAIQASISTPQYIHKRNENTCP